MQIICRILQLSNISIMVVERDKSWREGILLRMSTRDSVPLRILAIWARERPFGRDLLGGCGDMPHRKTLSTLRCNVVQSGPLNLANARIPY